MPRRQVNNYDLSEKGRTSWTPDSTQPGYGNFCYGNRKVTSIDNSTVGTNSVGVKTVSVSYHYQIANVAAWANSPEMKTAYPGIASSLARILRTMQPWLWSEIIGNLRNSADPQECWTAHLRIEPRASKWANPKEMAMVRKTVTSASGTRAPRATLISVSQAKALRRIILPNKKAPNSRLQNALLYFLDCRQ